MDSAQATQLLEKALAIPDINGALLAPRTPRRMPRLCPWQVDSLLNEAIDLLERNQAERMIYDDLRARWIELSAQVLSEQSELEHMEKRVAEGVHTLQRQIDEYDLYATNRYLDPANQQYEPPNTEFGWGEIFRCFHIGTHSNSNNEASKHMHATSYYMAQKDTRKIKDTLPALQHRITLSNWDAIRVESVVKTLRLVYDKKSEAMTSKGGALNLPERFAALEAQMQMDYDNALDRLKAAQEGLKAYYGYTSDPDNPSLPDDKTLESLVTWARHAISWLVSFHYRDQAFTMTISLKEVLAENAADFFKSLRETGAARGRFRWSGPEDDKLLYVRLTSLLAYYLGEDKDTHLSVKLNVPQKAISRHVQDLPMEAGALQGVHEVLLGQPLPPCVLGRVEHRDRLRVPENAGSLHLSNVSPLSSDEDGGEWEIEVQRTYPNSAQDIKVDDIMIEVLVRAQFQ